MPIAYSYQRFSRPEQLQGDSLRRQQDAAERYCAAHGLELSQESYRDLGLSAFTGANLGPRSQLSVFKDAVRTGKIRPGSTLLVEHFDRLSRQTPLDALNVLQEILDLGIVVVTLHDGATFTSQTIRQQPYALLTSLMKMQLSWEESQKKSERLSAVYANKRRTNDTHIALPLWIRRGREDELVLDESVAPAVRRMFELAATEGIGGRAIARRLSSEGYASPAGRASWAHATINRILKSRSAIGEYQPHTKAGGNSRAPIGEPKHGFYPAVVNLATFVRANASRRPTGPKVSPIGPRNLFTGLLFCTCGATLHLKRWSARDTHDRLICSARCGEPSIRYDHFEFVSVTGFQEMLIERIDEMEHAAAPSHSPPVELEADLQLGIDRLIQLVVDGFDSASVRERLQSLETEKAAIRRTNEAALTLERNQKEDFELMRKMAGHEYMMRMDDLDFRLQLGATVRRWIDRADLIRRDSDRVMRWKFKSAYWIKLDDAVDGTRELPVRLS